MDEVERIYEEFWKPLVEKDGEIDIEQVKKELHDFYLLMGNAAVVYMVVTGGVLSKSTYTAEAVISQYRRRLEDYVEAELKKEPAAAWGDVPSWKDVRIEELLREKEYLAEELADFKAMRRQV